MKDLFGIKIAERTSLVEQFGAVPVSVFNTNKGWYTDRQKHWNKLNIKSDLGRGEGVVYSASINKINNGQKLKSHTSIFSPTICELMYNWFCPAKGRILDPFAGGSVRGVMAHKLGFKYVGIELREEQVKANINQGEEILSPDNQPIWIIGDSNKQLDSLANEYYDMVFSCPPYHNLEIYSDLDNDISNMSYSQFLKVYESIIKKSIDKLKKGGYAIFVVGEVRDKKGNYIGFVPDTIKAFQAFNMKYYNEIVIYGRIAGKALIAGGTFKKSKKITKVHQTILIFKK